jgi:iron-sulfur cluster repair protein YtfE (RIC family)
LEKENQMENGIAKEMESLEIIRSERPRISALAGKVARVHGGGHPELPELASMVDRLFKELEPHSETDPAEAGRILARIRTLTSGYRPPQDACNSYLALFQGLERIEAEMPERMRKGVSVPPVEGKAAGCGDGAGSCCSV